MRFRRSWDPSALLDEGAFAPYRRTYIFQNSIEFVMGIAVIVASITFFLDPDSLRRNSVGVTLHPFDFAWNAIYGVSGLMILWGLWRPSLRFELGGLLFLVGALLVQITAIWSIAGYPGIAVLLSLLTFVVGFLIRAWVVLCAALARSPYHLRHHPNPAP